MSPLFLLLSHIKFPLLYFTFTNEEQVHETLGSLPLNPIKVEPQVPSYFRKNKQKKTWALFLLYLQPLHMPLGVPFMLKYL